MTQGMHTWGSIISRLRYLSEEMQWRNLYNSHTIVSTQTEKHFYSWLQWLTICHLHWTTKASLSGSFQADSRSFSSHTTSYNSITKPCYKIWSSSTMARENERTILMEGIISSPGPSGLRWVGSGDLGQIFEPAAMLFSRPFSSM